MRIVGLNGMCMRCFKSIGIRGGGGGGGGRTNTFRPITVALRSDVGAARKVFNSSLVAENNNTSSVIIISHCFMVRVSDQRARRAATWFTLQSLWELRAVHALCALRDYKPRSVRNEARIYSDFTRIRCEHFMDNKNKLQSKFHWLLFNISHKF